MLLTTLILTASMSVAQAEPSREDVKAVFDHYYNGNKAILVEAVLCKTIETKDKETRHDCKETFGSQAAKNDRVAVYVVALVPRNAESNLMLQASHNGVVRSTRDIKLVGKNWFRARGWRQFRLSKPGKWSFKVLNEDGTTLKSMSVTVPES